MLKTREGLSLLVLSAVKTMQKNRGEHIWNVLEIHCLPRIVSDDTFSWLKVFRGLVGGMFWYCFYVRLSFSLV